MHGIENLGSTSAPIHLFSDRVRLVAGKSRLGLRERYTGPMKRGLKIAVLLDSVQSYQLDDDPALTISGSTLFVALNESEHVQTRTVLSEDPFRFAMVQLDPNFARTEFGEEFELLSRRLLEGEPVPGLLIRAADPAFRSLAIQMTESRIHGPMRNMYMGAKALELVALVFDKLLGEVPVGARHLSTRTVEQVHAVREILIASAQNPPSLAELARQTGLNASKLTSGFRQVFGASVFAYLQEYRLQSAYELIRSGEMSVAEAAYHVGYNPAHFSGLFRKRFGVLPSNLR